MLREIRENVRIDYLYGAEGIIGFEYAENIGVMERYYYLKNVQGDITHIVDKNGNVMVEYKYDAWDNHDEFICILL